MAVFAVMVYRVTISAVLYPITESLNLSYSQLKLAVSLSAASMNLVIIVILNKVTETVEWSGPDQHTVSFRLPCTHEFFL